MADIFVSYASEDRDRIRALVEVLEAEGWSVWWDRELVAGPSFEATIQGALDEARCVVVAWSDRAIRSGWCCDEAQEGLDRKILVPARIDDVRPPLGFRSSQTASLVGWPQQTGELESFLEGVRRCLRASIERASEPLTPRRNLGNSIAVLPFVNLSSDPEQSFLSDGIAEQILNLLSKNPDLRVVSRSSSFWFKDKDADIPSVVSKLRVTHVLEGSVMKAGDKLRVTAQLIDGQSDAHLWAATYDRELDDVFAIQDDIAASVANQLNVALQKPPPKRPENTDAYLLMLQARHLLGEGERHNLPAVESLLQRALQLDSNYAEALNELSRLHWQKRWNGLEPMRKSALLSRELSERVLAIDPDNAVATMGRAWHALEIDGDLAAALQFVRRAIELDPTQTRALHPSAPFMLRADRIKDAIAVGEYVVQHDPLSVIPINNLGNAYLLDGRFDDAEAQFNSALALHSGSDGALAGLCKLELLRGNAEQAKTFAKQIRNPVVRSPLLASAFFDSNHPQEALEVLAKLRNWWPEVPLVAIYLASYYAWTADSDNAFAWLTRALEKREEVTLTLYDVLADPLWKSHRSDPRWRQFLEETGQLPEQLANSYFELRLPD